MHIYNIEQSILSLLEKFDENTEFRLTFNDGKIIGVIANDMDGDSLVDLVITQLEDDGKKRKTSIIPQLKSTPGKFDSKN